MIFRDGWYYLLVTHGSCCAGANSSYNIRMGRARKVTGPFLDNMGIDMLQGGGKLFLGSGGRYIGPGHFGLLDLGDGVQKFSCHYEADLDRGGVSVLDIRPLLWRDGWPVAGENFKEGTYQIESARTGTALELAVPGHAGRRIPRKGRARWPRRVAAAMPFRAEVIPAQDAAQVSANWPSGPVDVRMSPYMVQAQQKWTDHAGRERGRLSRIAVLQDHDRRHGPRARGDGRPRARRAPRVHRRTRAAVAHRPTHRRDVSRDAEGGARIRRNRWPCPPSAAASRRSPDSAPTAIGSAGCSRHRERRDAALQIARTDLPGRPRQLRGVLERRRPEQHAGVARRQRSRAPKSPAKAPERRRVHPALARPRAYSDERPADRQRRAGGGQDRLLSRSAHGDAARRRQGHRRRRRS